MCVIIVKPAGKVIPGTHLREGNKTNPHGWGIAVRHPDGTFQIRRGFSSRAIVKAYNELGGDKYDMVVHCRIGTSGKMDLGNTHPFQVVDGTIVFHNGIFRSIPLTNPDKSDTWHFAQKMKPLFEKRDDVLKDEIFLNKLEQFCQQGYPNKLVFMTRKDIVIVNKRAGVERGGLWYSNSTAFPMATYSRSRNEVTPSLDDAPWPWTSNAEPQRQLVRIHKEYEPDVEPYIPDSCALQTRFDNSEQRKWEQYVNNKYGVTDGVVRDTGFTGPSRLTERQHQRTRKMARIRKAG